MKAIDFSVRLLAGLNDLTCSRTGLTLFEMKLLIGIAAGLHYSEDLARELHLHLGATTNSLARLIRFGYIYTFTVDKFTDYTGYKLTDEGKEIIAKLFSFLDKK